MRGYYNLAQELVYQWLGSWITPVGERVARCGILSAIK